MGLSSANHRNGVAGSNVVKIAVTFSVAMVTTFAGALMYSVKSDESWNSFASFSPRGSGQPSSSEQPVATLIPNRSPADHSVPAVSEQDTAAKVSSGRKAKFASAAESQHGRRMPHAYVHMASELPAMRSNVPVQWSAQPQHIPQSDLLTSKSQDHSVAAPRSETATPPDALNAKAAIPHLESKEFTVERGASVDVRLAEALSSDRNFTGETFRAVLDSPLAVNGIVLAGKDSSVVGRIADVRKSSIIGGRAHLRLTLTGITTTDGRIITVDTTNIERLGARLGVLTGTRRTVLLPAGTQVSFNLTDPLRVTEQMGR